MSDVLTYQNGSFTFEVAGGIAHQDSNGQPCGKVEFPKALSSGYGGERRVTVYFWEGKPYGLRFTRALIDGELLIWAYMLDKNE